MDELPQVGIIGDTLLQLKIETIRTIGCEIISFENGFILVPQLVSELWVLSLSSPFVNRTHPSVLHIGNKIVQIPRLNIWPLILLHLRNVLDNKIFPDFNNVLNRNQAQCPDVTDFQHVVLLDVGPQGTFEVFITSDNSSGAEHIFQNLDDATLKIAVEERRVINITGLQALKNFLLSNGFFAMEQGKGRRDIDPCVVLMMTKS